MERIIAEYYGQPLDIIAPDYATMIRYLIGNRFITGQTAFLDWTTNRGTTLADKYDEDWVDYLESLDVENFNDLFDADYWYLKIMEELC